MCTTSSSNEHGPNNICLQNNISLQNWHNQPLNVLGFEQFQSLLEKGYVPHYDKQLFKAKSFIQELVQNFIWLVLTRMKFIIVIWVL